MTPDDAKALAEFESELKRFGSGPPGPFGHRFPWLIRVIHELNDRISELEEGEVPEVIAKHDAELAKRDAHAAGLAAKVAELEALKLPDPNVAFRRAEPIDKVNSDALSDAETIASRSDR